jgi:thiamine monophosphate synthase
MYAVRRLTTAASMNKMSRQVWQAGADSAAMISDILGVDDIAAKTKRILEAGLAV